MRIFKLISGILLLLLSILLSLVTLSATLKNSIENANEIQKTDAEQLGYITGIIIFFSLMVIVIYFLSKFSLKLIQNKPNKKIDEINQIGKQNTCD